MTLISEDNVLATIGRFFPQFGGNERLLVGPGDDCAVLQINAPLCISTDIFAEDIHFRRRYFSPQDIGWKSLAVNLSDLAAAGATPLGFSMGLTLPVDTSIEFLHGLLEGMAEAASMAGIALTGGDLSRGEKLHLCITVFGEAPAPLKRGQAKPGDTIFLIGQVGLAKTGFSRLEADSTTAIRTYPEACAAHLHPLPRLDAGHILHDFAAAHPQARIGLMDLSDGLARDLPRLIGLRPSGSAGRKEHAPGADITLPPPHPEIARYCAANELNATKYRLAGGEDFALIGTCDKRSLPLLAKALPELFVLGTVSDDTSLRCDGSVVEEGFDHFA